MAIDAEKSIGAIQLNQIQIWNYGIEYRQTRLFAIGYMYEQKSRFYRLDSRRIFHRALKHESGIETGDWHRSNRIVALTGRRVAQVVACVIEGNGRLHEPPGSGNWQRDFGHQVQSPPCYSYVAIEIDEFSSEPDLQAQPLLWP